MFTSDPSSAVSALTPAMKVPYMNYQNSRASTGKYLMLKTFVDLKREIKNTTSNGVKSGDRSKKSKK